MEELKLVLDQAKSEQVALEASAAKEKADAVAATARVSRLTFAGSNVGVAVGLDTGVAVGGYFSPSI